MKVLKIVAVVYLFSLIVLISRHLDEPGCINSITVQSINIERDQESVFTPSCYFEMERSGTPVLGDKKTIKALSSAIESFEKILRTNGLFYKLNSLKITIKDSPELVVSSSQIQMSSDHARDFNLVRKTLLKSWFLNFSSQKIKNDKFIQEIISDIFLYVFWNEMEWEKEPNFLRWTKYVYSEKDICKTPFMPKEGLAFCDLIKGSKEFDQVSPWSIRPLIVNRILNYYDQMNLEKKLEFSKYWIHFVTTFDGKIPKKSLSLYTISDIYSAYMDQLVGSLLKVKFEETLSIDYVFEFHIPKLDSMITQKKDLPFYMTKNILFKYKNNSFINLRNGSKITSKKAFSKHWVMVQDQFPELSDVKDLIAEYLTIIQAKKDYDLNQFYKKVDDISKFPWNDEFDSLTIYLPSLKLLGRLAPNELKTSDIRALYLNPRVPKILGWNPIQVY